MQNKGNVDYNTARKGDTDMPGTAFNTARKNYRKMFSDRFRFSIFDLYRRYKRGEFHLRTSQIKKNQWTGKKKSGLIESILLKIPIPIIYMAEGESDKMEVVDGQQRLAAIFDFLDNKYPLKHLAMLTYLDGKRFKDLETDYIELQRKLEEYPLSILVIKKESHPDIRSEISRRMNQ